MLLSAGAAHVDARPKVRYSPTALQIAAMVGNQRLVHLLLLKTADINVAASVLEGGLTTLQAATHHSDTELLSFLINQGADVNIPVSSRHGKSALRVAIARQNTEAVRFYLMQVHPSPLMKIARRDYWLFRKALKFPAWR
jgi:ankyrin repeat protein